MSSRFNLNDNANDKFEFTLGGLDYDFIYPTLDEIRPFQDITTEREKLEKDDSPEAAEKMAKLNEKAEDLMYSFIHPVGHETPVKETLSKQNIKVVQMFNKKLTELLQAE